MIWPSFDNVFRSTTIWGLVGTIEGGLFISAAAVFQGKLRFDLTVAATSLGALVTLTGVIVLAGQQMALPGLMLAYVAGWLVTGVVSVVFLKKYVHQVSPLFDWMYIKSTLAAVWPVSATLILNTIYFRVDAFILAHYYPLDVVGIYNIAYQIFQTALVFPTFVMNSYYPIMVANFASSPRLFWQQVKKATLLMATLAAVGTLVTLLSSTLVIDILTGGNGFKGSSTALNILALGFPAFFASSVLMWVMMTTKKFRPMFFIYSAVLVVNILLNLWLIPLYSYLAASWVTVACEYLILGLQLVILVRRK